MWSPDTADTPLGVFAYMAVRKRTRRTQEERSADTQGRILDAAIVLLRKKGSQGFRVGEVARLAKISLGAQTHHFPSKDALIFAAVERFFAESEEASLAAIRALGPSDDLVEAMMKDAERFFLGPVFSVVLDLLNVGVRQSQLDKRISTNLRKRRVAVEQAWVNEIVARGLASAQQARDAQWFLFNAFRGIALRHILDVDSKTEQRGLVYLRRSVLDILGK